MSRLSMWIAPRRDTQFDHKKIPQVDSLQNLWYRNTSYRSTNLHKLL